VTYNPEENVGEMETTSLNGTKIGRGKVHRRGPGGNVWSPYSLTRERRILPRKKRGVDAEIKKTGDDQLPDSTIGGGIGTKKWPTRKTGCEP